MPQLARTTPRTPAAAPKTKVLLVRQPVKSVRRSDEIDRLGVRLAIGVITGLGVLASIWLAGYLGFRLGFAQLMRVPDLQIELTGGLAAGAAMLLHVPRVVLQAGVIEPAWLMLGFVLIAIPAASLGGIQPTAPGGPRPAPAVVVLSFTGAIAAMLNACALVAWSASAQRGALIQAMPSNPAGAESWLTNLEIAAGLDVLGLIAAALWVVVVMRLAVPRWLRGLSAAASFAGLVIIAGAWSISAGAASQVAMSRPLVHGDAEAPGARLLIGSAAGNAVASLHADANMAVIELRTRPQVLMIVEGQSIVEYLRQRVPREE